jgi:uncharacterized protein
MPRTTSLSSYQDKANPDYVGLADFLLKPFLEFPESLNLDCERLNNDQRVWIRAAFESSDKGRVFGRGGRNIQAIRSVLSTAAKIAGQSLHLEIYGGDDGHEDDSYLPTEDNSFKRGRRRHRTSRPLPSKPSLRTRLR